MSVVPALGHAISLVLPATGTVFRVVGGFAQGLFLRRVHLMVQCSRSDFADFSVALAIGGSNEPTQVALEAGRPLFRAADQFIGKVPAWSGEMIAGGYRRIVVPVGIRIETGSKFLVIALGASATGATFLYVGVEFMQVVKDRGAKGES